MGSARQYLDVEGGASDQPVSSITSPAHVQGRWTTMSAVSALLLTSAIIFVFDGQTQAMPEPTNSIAPGHENRMQLAFGPAPLLMPQAGLFPKRGRVARNQLPTLKASAADVREEYAKESKDQVMSGADRGGLHHQGPDLSPQLGESREQQREHLSEWLRAKGLLRGSVGTAQELLDEKTVAAEAAAKAEQNTKAAAATELEASVDEKLVASTGNYEAAWNGVEVAAESAEAAELLKSPAKVVWEIKDQAKGVVEVVPPGSFKKVPAQSNSKASSDKPSVLSLKLAKTIVVWLAATSMGIFALLKVTTFFDVMMAGVTGVGEVAGQTAASAAGRGVLTGALHTLAGPDHFAGVMPLVIGQRRSTAGAFGIGALWGSGHAFGQLLLGLACLAVQMGLLRFAWTSSFAGMFGNINDLLIGLALMGIGWLGFKESRQFDQAAEVSATSTQRYGFTTFGTGVLHGLAPDSILFLAPALALPKVAAVCHLSGIAVGTLLAMGFFTATLKIIAARGSVKLKFFSQVASGTAVLFGTSFLISALSSYLGWSFAWPLMWGKALA